MAGWIKDGMDDGWMLEDGWIDGWMEDGLMDRSKMD